MSVDYLISDTYNENQKSVKIAVYGKIAAGLPIEAIEDIIDYEEIPTELAKTGEFFALQIKGDSMEPRIYNGDVVIIKKQETCESGQICAVLINGDEATLKRVVKRKNGITLIPLNPKYDPINFTNEEIEEKPVRIIGKAIEVRGKI